MNKDLNGQKVYLNDWLETLVKNINKNIEVNEELKSSCKDEEKQKEYDRHILNDNKLLKKLETYKKTDSEGHVFYYFFPNELEDIMWILLENSLLGVSIA